MTLFSTLLPWVLFNGFVLAMLIFDLFVLHKHARVVTLKEALGWTAFWISLALFFNAYIYYSQGAAPALNFLTGYVIELSLSVDNLFVFLMLFKYFRTPASSLHKVLFYGVLGAIVMRAFFIGIGIALIEDYYWMVYIFGAFLVFSGIKMAFAKNADFHPEKNPILKLFKRFFPFTEEYENDKFWIKRAGRYVATPLFVVLIAVETTDVIFAIDSVPAILAITLDPFIVYTSNIFAVLGLRALYFLLSHMITAFHHLHHGLAFILTFIGVKMVLADIFKIPTLAALGVVFGVLIISIGASLLFPEKK